MPEGAVGGKVEIKNTDGKGTMASFGKIKFTEADAGKTYTYKVTESGTVDGVENGTAEYTVTVTVKDNGDGTLTATATPDDETLFTNTYKVKPITAEIPVEKLIQVPEGWEEWNDLTGKFTFTLTAEDGTPLPETTSYTNPDPDGGKVTFGAIEFTKPGTYTYTVTESGEVPGITNDAKASQTVTIKVVDNGNGTMTATVDPEAGITFTNKMDLIGLTVEKIWDDNDDQDGKRPESITVTLFANDKEVETVDLTAPDWAHDFTDLPEYQNGEKVTYSVKEADGDFSEFYEASYVGLVITNTHEIIKIDVEVEKVWKDNDDAAGLRPESITVQLLKNGEAFGDPVKLTGEEKWSHTWTMLDRYENGKEIEYSIDEISEIPAYVTGELVVEKDENGNFMLSLTNTLVTPVTDDPPVQKEVTKDKPEKEDEFTFVLTPVSGPNDMAPEDMPMPEGNEKGILTIKASDGKVEFGVITFYFAGTYVYTITEDAADALKNYKYDDTVYTLTYEITQEGTEMKKVLTVTKGDGEVVEDAVYVFQNEYTAPPIDIPVEKVWKGEVDPEKTRPKSITVVLLADGKDSGKTLVLTEETEWKGVFEDLPSQDNGKKIEYTIQEIEVEYYTSTITGNMDEGFVITNICTYVDTGDHSNLLLWSASMAASMAGIGFVLKKKREEEAE